MERDVDVDIVVLHKADKIVVNQTAVGNNSILGYPWNVLEGAFEFLDGIEIKKRLPAPVLYPFKVVNVIIVEKLSELLAKGVDIFLSVKSDFLSLKAVRAMPVAGTTNHEVNFGVWGWGRH